MKKNIILLIISLVILILITFVICINIPKKTTEKDNRITIVTTLFPSYDFASKIAGEKANVSLIVPPGVETHSYEYSASDIIKIADADLFIYTGESLEGWTRKLKSSLSSTSNFVDITYNMTLIKNLDDDDDDLVYDPHIWMSIKNAKIMCENIYNALVSKDKDNTEYYKQNYESLLSKLDELDQKFMTINANSKVIFASPFSYIYMTNEYSIDYISAYDYCHESAEPTINRIKEIIDYIKENNVKYILCDKMYNNKTANTIVSETGVQILNFNSIHNTSKDDFENNTSYMDLMNENYNSILKTQNGGIN